MKINVLFLCSLFFILQTGTIAILNLLQYSKATHTIHSSVKMDFDGTNGSNVAYSLPNFVVILVDDLGWTGTSIEMDSSMATSKSGFYQTPNIDTLLAQKGMIFSQAYAPAPKCSPSRCAIMTGQTTARNRFTETSASVPTDERLLPPRSNVSIDSDDTTIGEWLKAAGYTTAHYGKWHLRNGGTAAHGFDNGDGQTDNNDGDQGGTIQADPKRIFSLRDSAITFINAAHAAGQPFYLQISHWAVHGPTEVQQTTLDLYNNAAERPNNSNGNHQNAPYGGMTEDMDTGTGDILRLIESLGLDQNTYIVFTSDNGAAANTSSNVPLSGGKVKLTEGGIRVPFIIKGPNVPANSYNTTPVIGYDLFPTFAALTGSNAALPVDIDGVNIAPLLLGNEINRNEPLYFHSPHYGNGGKVPVSAAIEDTFKLKVNYEVGSIVLYNLAADIGETMDVSDLFPTIFNRLRLKLRNHFLASNAELPTLNEAHADWTATAQTNDADGDGLNDVWEFTQLLTHADSANGDPDRDGFTNLEEQTNNTDPLIAEAIFACQSNYNLGNGVVESKQTVPASETITSSQEHTGDSVVYSAGVQITLATGFHIIKGTAFTAKIESCTPALMEEVLVGRRLEESRNSTELWNKKETLKIAIFPNPTNNYFAIDGLQNLSNREYQIKLFDLKGKQYSINASNPKNMTVGDLPKGLYLVVIDVIGEEQIIKKLIIQ
jgi:arylsulfatase A-like enzyme